MTTLLLLSLIFMNAVRTTFAYYDFSNIQLRKPVASPEPQCSSLKYACMYGDCIPGNRRCDDHPDCPMSGDDEAGCICEDNEFQCLSNKCIDSGLRCNGIFDCPNAESNSKTGEDELFCSCPDGSVMCPLDGNCIKKYGYCDGTEHCESGSVEIDCDDVRDYEENAALQKLFQELKQINLAREAHEQHERQMDEEILERLRARSVLN